ncbi:hypothetical protein GCM10023203_51740 [Actinomycetospora straminea]|uniref:Uncharacterized protein n=1 Tax=Actinomycetospora straminea TaxID=663607 RepID=A0ABP9F357_9PSEU
MVLAAREVSGRFTRGPGSTRGSGSTGPAVRDVAVRAARGDGSAPPILGFAHRRSPLLVTTTPRHPRLVPGRHRDLPAARGEGRQGRPLCRVGVPTRASDPP